MVCVWLMHVFTHHTGRYLCTPPAAVSTLVALVLNQGGVDTLTPVLTLILNKEDIVFIPICKYLELSQRALFQPGRPFLYRELVIAFQHMFTPGPNTCKPPTLPTSVKILTRSHSHRFKSYNHILQYIT